MIALLSVPIVWWALGILFVWVAIGAGVGTILGSAIHMGERQDWDEDFDSDWYGRHDPS